MGYGIDTVPPGNQARADVAQLPLCHRVSRPTPLQYISALGIQWFGKVTHQPSVQHLGHDVGDTQLLPQGDVDKADHVHDLQPLLQGALASKLFNTTQGKPK